MTEFIKKYNKVVEDQAQRYQTHKGVHTQSQKETSRYSKFESESRAMYYRQNCKSCTKVSTVLEVLRYFSNTQSIKKVQN